MNRRGFLASILAAGVAPAFVGSSILMPVRQIVRTDEPEWIMSEFSLSTLTKSFITSIEANGIVVWSGMEEITADKPTVTIPIGPIGSSGINVLSVGWKT